MPKKWLRYLLVLLSPGLFASSAHAHGAMVGANDFIAGLVHPATALGNALPIFMLGVAVGQNDLRRCEFVFWLFPLSIALGAIAALKLPGIPAVYLLNIVSVVVLGLLVALGKKLPLVILFFLVALFGLSHGYANGAEVSGPIRPAYFISGVVLSAFFLLAYGCAVTDFLLRRSVPWIPIAVRVSGSWSAAIGLLVLSVSQKAILFS